MCVPFGTIAAFGSSQLHSLCLTCIYLPGAFVSHTSECTQADARRRLLIQWRRILLPWLLFYSLLSIVRYMCTVKSSHDFAYCASRKFPALNNSPGSPGYQNEKSTLRRCGMTQVKMIIVRGWLIFKYFKSLLRFLRQIFWNWWKILQKTGI